jgi:hypothetical protein
VSYHRSLATATGPEYRRESFEIALSSRRVAYDAELDFCVQLAEFAPDLKISVSACQ